MSLRRLMKDWTLPMAMATGSLLYLVFGMTPALDETAQLLGPFFETILPLFMFLILFVTFCKVDFHRLRPVAWHLWVGLLQVLFVGAVMAIILVMDLSARSLVVSEALLCCIIGPTAAAAAVVTQKLGGKLEEMTTYTFISNFITVALIPVCFPLVEKGHDISFSAAFVKILREVIVVLLVPMLLAYIVKHHLRRFHNWVTSVRDLSYYLWALSLMIVTGTTVRNIVHAETDIEQLAVIALSSLVVCGVQFAVGRLIGRYCRRPIEAGQALGQKNTAFAIWMSYSYLNPLSSVGPGCYILWQNIVNSAEIWRVERGERREDSEG